MKSVFKMEDIKKRLMKEALFNEKIKKKYYHLICTYCNLPTTHVLVTGQGKYPNYDKITICDECTKYVYSLSDYKLDILGFVDIYRL